MVAWWVRLHQLFSNVLTHLKNEVTLLIWTRTGFEHSHFVCAGWTALRWLWLQSPVQTTLVLLSVDQSIDPKPRHSQNWQLKLGQVTCRFAVEPLARPQQKTKSSQLWDFCEPNMTQRVRLKTPSEVSTISLLGGSLCLVQSLSGWPKQNLSELKPIMRTLFTPGAEITDVIWCHFLTNTMIGLSPLRFDFCLVL